MNVNTHSQNMQATQLALKIKKLKTIRSLYRRLITVMVVFLVWWGFVTAKSHHSILRNLRMNDGGGIELLHNHAQLLEITVIFALVMYMASYGLCLFKIKKNRVQARHF